MVFKRPRITVHGPSWSNMSSSFKPLPQTGQTVKIKAHYNFCAYRHSKNEAIMRFLSENLIPWTKLLHPTTFGRYRRKDEHQDDDGLVWYYMYNPTQFVIKIHRFVLYQRSVMRPDQSPGSIHVAICYKPNTVFNVFVPPHRATVDFLLASRQHIHVYVCDLCCKPSLYGSIPH